MKGKTVTGIKNPSGPFSSQEGLYANAGRKKPLFYSI